MSKFSRRVLFNIYNSFSGPLSPSFPGKLHDRQGQSSIGHCPSSSSIGVDRHHFKRFLLSSGASWPFVTIFSFSPLGSGFHWFHYVDLDDRLVRV